VLADVHDASLVAAFDLGASSVMYLCVEAPAAVTVDYRDRLSRHTSVAVYDGDGDPVLVARALDEGDRLGLPPPAKVEPVKSKPY
jgi:hypothetical protein